MLKKLTASLRQNTWLMLVAFAAFTAASVVGHFTVDAASTTPAIWLATMWAMLGLGAVIVLAVAAEAILAIMED